MLIIIFFNLCCPFYTDTTEVGQHNLSYFESFLLCITTKQVDLSCNASDLYLEGAWFKS
jgi:hypothetical protein